jgi:hypothetical protein
VDWVLVSALVVLNVRVVLVAPAVVEALGTWGPLPVARVKLGKVTLAARVLLRTRAAAVGVQPQPVAVLVAVLAVLAVRVRLLL